MRSPLLLHLSRSMLLTEMDRFLMGMFAYVYYSSLIRTNTVTVVGLLHTITTSLSTEDQKLLLHALQRVVAKSH